MQPLLAVDNVLYLKTTSTLVEWTYMSLNSALWGAAFAGIVLFIHRRRRLAQKSLSSPRNVPRSNSLPRGCRPSPPTPLR